MSHSQPLLVELQTTLTKGSPSQRFEMLRRVTDLFLTNAESYSHEQVDVFDDVMEVLVDKIERQALIELSGRLAPIHNGPTRVVHRLSSHDDIAISGPILERSTMLSDSFLVQIASTKSQAHLAAIAGREIVNETITDVLVERGDIDVARKVTANAGANFSRFGHARLAGRAADDEQLAVTFARRRDVPPEIFDQLVQKATETVRKRLLVNAAPEMRDRIKRTLAGVAGEVARNERARAKTAPAGGGGPRVSLKHDVTQLKAQVSQLAGSSKAAETIEALATLSGVPTRTVRYLVQKQADDGIIILGKAAGLGWPDLKNVLNATMREKMRSAEDVKVMFEKFVSLSHENAQRVLRFIKSSEAASLADIRKMM